MEFALLLPLLLLLVVGAIEFGRLFFIKIALTNAAREGAYYLSTHPSDFSAGTAPETLKAVHAEALNSGIPVISGEPPIPDVDMVIENCCSRNNKVKVTVTAGFPDLFILDFFASKFSINELSSSVEMMVQP